MTVLFLTWAEIIFSACISPRCLEKIKQINGVNFEWSDKQSTYTGKDVGVIAQDVEKVLPEVVTEREDGYLAVKYEKIIPLLIEAIKDQQKEIEELKSKLS